MGKGETQIHGPCLYDLVGHARQELTAQAVRHCQHDCPLNETARRTGLMVSGYKQYDNDRDHSLKDVRSRMRAVGNVYASSGVLPDVCPRRRQI